MAGKGLEVMALRMRGIVGSIMLLRLESIEVSREDAHIFLSFRVREEI